MTGSFSNLTWAVEEPFTEKEYLIAINAYIGHPHYAKKSEDTKLADDTTYKELNILRIREHEWTHYRQHISSHLGLFINQIHDIQEDAFFEYLKISSNQFNGNFYPIQAKDTSKNTRSSRIAYVWQMMDMLLGILDGHATTIENVILVWEIFIQIMSVNLNKNLSKLSTKLKLSEMSSPKAELTIYAISEGFAQFREIHYLLQFNFCDDDLMKILNYSFKGQYSTTI